MKKLIFISLAAVVILYSCDIRNQDREAQKNLQPEKKTVFTDTTSVTVIDTVYDFKSVKEGEIVEYNYRFKNSGNKPLVISDAHASCGCTVPEKPDHPIAPGEMGFIKVKFNSDKRPGEAHKTITVTSNANPEFPVLILKGTVIGKEQ